MARFLERLQVPDWDKDPEGLHQVRVAARRLGAVIDLVDPEAYDGHKGHRRTLKGLVTALGPVRELDVHALALQAHHQAACTPIQAASLEHLLEGLDRVRTKARRALKKGLADLRLKDLPRLLRVRSLPDPFQSVSLQEAAWTCLRPRLVVLNDLENLARQEDGSALHKARIQVKKLRYALEALEGAFAEPPEALLARLRDIQACLGTHHDLAALEAWLWEAEAHLRNQDRALLCGGVLDLLGVVAENRRAAFDQFSGLADSTSIPALITNLRASLGLFPLGGEPA